VTPEEEMEMRCLRLEKKNAELVAQNYNLRKRVDDLERMDKCAQAHIGKLQAQLKKAPKTLAEQVFRDD